jgi:putative hydrolase of HD superfamily
MPTKSPSSSVPDRDIELLYEVGCLRYVQRVWRQFLNPDFANLSEHILRVAWIALIIAQHEKQVDTGKLVKMVLVHDLAESRGVDVHYVSRQFATRHEEAALANTLQGTTIEQEFLTLNQEYEERKTLEAKIVKDADNLDVDFELKEQAMRGFTIGAKLQPMRKHVADTKLFTKAAKQIWKKLQTSDPHDWHWHSVNRFNAGDWKK